MLVWEEWVRYVSGARRGYQFRLRSQRVADDEVARGESVAEGVLRDADEERVTPGHWIWVGGTFVQSR